MPADPGSKLADAAPPKTDATRCAGRRDPAARRRRWCRRSSAATPISAARPRRRSRTRPRSQRGPVRRAQPALRHPRARHGRDRQRLRLYGMFIPFTATFLTFSDYMRPSIRLAALSRLQVVHVFTHDSVFLGEDGPTHQSVEHVSALRLIPQRARVASGRRASSARPRGRRRSSARDGPIELILSRQKVAEPPAGTRVDDARRGGYVILREAGGAPDVVFLATGSRGRRSPSRRRRSSRKGGTRVRVVSLPCLEVFARAGRRVARRGAARNGAARLDRSRPHRSLEGVGRLRRPHHRHRRLRPLGARRSDRRAARPHRRQGGRARPRPAHEVSETA